MGTIHTAEAPTHFPSSSAAPDSETYSATCHCGTVQYTVTLSPPLAQQKVVECNCSICSRNGYLLVYPLRTQVVLQRGAEALKTYMFGIKRNLHKFCGRCGSAVFFDPRMPEFGESPDLLGVNVRMFKNVKVSGLQIVPWDGWNKARFVDAEHLQ